MGQTLDIPAPAAPPALSGAVVAFTGRLASMTRPEAALVVEAAGGKCAATVTRRTTMLVVGMHGWPLLADGRLTRAIEEAESLQRRGYQLFVLSEEAFLELAGLRQRRDALHKSHTVDQVAALTGIDARTLQLWDRLGLVRSHDGLYDFQDIVSLQTIARLLADGTDAASIQRSIQALSAFLPGTERPLSQLKLVVEAREVAAEIDGALIGADGQLRLRFEALQEESPAGTEASVPMLTLSQTGPATSQDWSNAGAEAEEDGRLLEAETAYRNAVDLDPTSAELQFNLGNTLLAQGRRGAAEERFRQAISLEPGFTQAWFNLALAMEDSGRPGEAAQALERLITIDPNYADAYFNLATLYQHGGRAAAAVPLWRTFLKLEPRGEWADKAREVLTGKAAN